MKTSHILAIISEIVINGVFLIAYFLKYMNIFPHFGYSNILNIVLSVGVYVVPSIILASVIVNYIESRSFDIFLRKYIFSLVVLIPLFLTLDQEFTFLLGFAHLLYSILSLYETSNEKQNYLQDSSASEDFLSIQTTDQKIVSFNLSPAQWVLFSFAGVITIGALILMLPMSTVSDKSLSLIDAIFMSSSATCVTGLSTISIGNDLTTLGQVVILILIQIGGLSIMTLYASMTVLIGQSLGMKNRLLMLDHLNVSSLSELFEMIIDIIKYTFYIELCGAIILTIAFNFEGMNIGQAMYYGVFHSVSAFCNAGFALFDDSFVSYATNPIINFTLSALIILGGIGFVVMREINYQRKTRWSWHRLSFHTKVVLLSTVILIVSGTFFIFFAEFLHGIDNYSLWEKLQISFFQSVTLRTAGFNTIHLNSLYPFTVYVFTFFMFIGGSPGSTAGGIKTTTLAILLQTILTTMKGEKEVKMLNRRIPQDVVIRAIALTFISILIASILVPLLMAVEPNQNFLPILFEAISALGTVGLSLGITPYLTVAGKVVISSLMFLGRIGPLTLVLALGNKKNLEKKIDYPDGRIMIG